MSRPPAGLWSQLTTEDPARLVAELRQAGFPAAMVQAIVVTVIDAQLRTRLRERQDRRPPGRSSGASLIEELLDDLKLSRERDALITRVLGPEWRLDDHALRIEIADRFGALSPEKMLRVHAVMRDFQIATHEIILPVQSTDHEVLEVPELPDTFENLKPDETLSPEIVARLKALEADKNARLAALLTPAELEEHKLRTHPLLAPFALDLGEFEPTEDEFRALFAARQTPNAALRSSAGTDQSAAEAERQAQFAAALGPVRYAEYLQVVDPASSRLNRLVSRLGLPISAAMEITTLKREATERAGAIRSQRASDPSERDAELAALANKAAGDVALILGPRGLEAYQRYGGYWIDLLRPRSTSEADATPSPRL